MPAHFMRRVAFAISFAMAGLAVAAGIAVVLYRAGVKVSALGIDRLPVLEMRIARIAESDGRVVAFMGDSMIRDEDGLSVPRVLNTMLQSRTAAPIRVQSVADPGSAPFDFYFVAHPLAEAKPALVILPVNLRMLDPGLGIAELAGWVPLDQYRELWALPLHTLGLTLDRLLLDRLFVVLDSPSWWRALRREQALFGRGYWDLARGLQPLHRKLEFLQAEKFLTERLPSDPSRPSLSGVHDMYGPVLDGLDPDQPSVEFTRATVAYLTQRGIPVLVFTQPVNLDHLRRLGIEYRGGLSQSVTTLAQVVVGAGGGFADFHGMLPDGAFRDATGHLTDAGKVRLVRGLARRVAALLPPSGG